MKTFRTLMLVTAAAIAFAMLGVSNQSATAAQATPAATMAATGAGAATATATSLVATSAATTAPTMAATYDRTGWPTQFIVGIFGGEQPEAAIGQEQPLIDYLQSRLGIKIIAVTGTSYTAVIEAMAAGKADAFEVGPFSYLFAVQEAGAEAVAVLDNPAKAGGDYDPNLKPYYFSVILTKKGSGIKAVADIKGHSFSFVDPASTSGHLMPAQLLLSAGLNPDTDIKAIYAGSHPSSLLAIWNGKVDAGATFEQNWTDATNSGTVDSCVWPDGKINQVRTQAEIDALYASCPDGKLVPIAISDPIPNTPFAVKSTYPASFKQAIKDALLAIKNDPAFAKKLGRWYVDPTTDPSLKLDNVDAFYNPLRNVAKILKLDLKALAH